MNCSTPSSGFYSEVGGTQTTGQEPATARSNGGAVGGGEERPGESEMGGKMMYDELYQSAEQVRSKKHYQVSGKFYGAIF